MQPEQVATDALRRRRSQRLQQRISEQSEQPSYLASVGQWVRDRSYLTGLGHWAESITNGALVGAIVEDLADLAHLDGLPFTRRNPIQNNLLGGSQTPDSIWVSPESPPTTGGNFSSSQPNYEILIAAGGTPFNWVADATPRYAETAIAPTPVGSPFWLPLVFNRHAREILYDSGIVAQNFIAANSVGFVVPNEDSPTGFEIRGDVYFTIVLFGDDPPPAPNPNPFGNWIIVERIGYVG